MNKEYYDKLFNDLNPYVKLSDEAPYNGKIMFLEDYALAILLLDVWLHTCEVEGTTGLVINCNDVFVPAADAEDLPEDKIQEFYDYWKQDHRNGPIKWIAKQRGYEGY